METTTERTWEEIEARFEALSNELQPIELDLMGVGSEKQEEGQ